MSDELAELRTLLCRGAWRRLVDPQLDLVLLDRPDVWPAIVSSCGQMLAVDALEQASEANDILLVWGRACGSSTVTSVEITLRHSLVGTVSPNRIARSLLGGLPTDDRARAVLVLAREAVSQQPTPERAAALAVLERYPWA